ncbi:hypothetical protein D3C78_1396710 [compost metagenome]
MAEKQRIAIGNHPGAVAGDFQLISQRERGHCEPWLDRRRQRLCWSRNGTAKGSLEVALLFQIAEIATDRHAGNPQLGRKIFDLDLPLLADDFSNFQSAFQQVR